MSKSKEKGVSKNRRIQTKGIYPTNPDAYNHKIGKHFGVHSTTIHYACKRLGITRKKPISSLQGKKL